MKKTILLLAICILVSGCGYKKTTETAEKEIPASAVAESKTVMLYYPDENAVGLIAEEYEISEKTPEAVLEALFNGPYTEKSVSAFGKDTHLLGFDLTAGEATVDVSGGFLESTGDSLAIYSVVNTLTEFDDISFVRITVEGSENAVLGNFILSESFTRNETLMK